LSGVSGTRGTEHRRDSICQHCRNQSLRLSGTETIRGEFSTPLYGTDDGT
jgi:hypothetical protein